MRELLVCVAALGVAACGGSPFSLVPQPDAGTSAGSPSIDGEAVVAPDGSTGSGSSSPSNTFQCTPRCTIQPQCGTHMVDDGCGGMIGCSGGTCAAPLLCNDAGATNACQLPVTGCSTPDPIGLPDGGSTTITTCEVVGLPTECVIALSESYGETEYAASAASCVVDVILDSSGNLVQTTGTACPSGQLCTYGKECLYNGSQDGTCALDLPDGGS